MGQVPRSQASQAEPRSFSTASLALAHPRRTSLLPKTPIPSPNRPRRPSTRRWMRSRRRGIATIGMTATDPETEPGPEPIRGTFRSLENRKPRKRRMRIAPRCRRRLGYVAMDALQAAILDEFACKLAAIDCCVPKADRAAARQALLSERAAKLRRASETTPRPEVDLELSQSRRRRQWFGLKRLRYRIRPNKSGFALRRSRPKPRSSVRYERLASPSAG